MCRVFSTVEAQPTAVIFITIDTTTTPTSGYRSESVGRLAWRVEQQSGPQGYETEIPTLSPIRFPALYATVTSKFSHDPLRRNSGFTSPNVTSTYSRCPRCSLCQAAVSRYTIRSPIHR